MAKTAQSESKLIINKTTTVAASPIANKKKSAINTDNITIEKTKKDTKPVIKNKTAAKGLQADKNKNINKAKLFGIPKITRRHKKLNLAAAVRYHVTPKHGLTTEQVNERKASGFVNVADNKNIKTYRSIFFSNIFTFFNLLCILVSAALIAVGAFNNLVFMVTIIANVAIGIIQEIRAKKTIEKISLVTAPTAEVLRDGKIITLPVKEIVLDDVIHYVTGKQISADSILLEGEVEVNESLLTGESNAIKKKKGDTLLSGSFVVSGKCVARVDKVGNFNYSSILAAKAKQYKKPQSELLKSLKYIIQIIGVIIVPLAILMFNNNMALLNNLPDTVKKTAGSIIGMIPAGMFLLTSLTLAVGVVKLARKHTLVQDLYSIEMLARTDTLCLDKTGTITDGTMKVNVVIQLENSSSNTINEIMGSMLTALDDSNQTSKALVNYFGQSKVLTAKHTLPFNSTRKLSAVSFVGGETYAYGAPEFVYKQVDESVDKLVKQYASRGYRTLLLIKCAGTISGDTLPSKCTPVALIIIEDHIREDAAATIQWFKDNDVKIKIISGDNPITVSEVSKRVGVENADKYISLDGLNEQQVTEAAEKYTVFGRVSPEQKYILIKALKSKGHKVAMTGDGVNDILALKEADCSIAMASGSEATRNISNLVLLDSSFASMPSVVAEGRRVVNNIQKSSSLFLMKTIFTIMLSVLCLIFALEYPFNTNQILLVETIVIGIPSFFLAMQSNTERIKGKFLSNLLRKSLPGSLIFLIDVTACYLFNRFAGTGGQYETMASIAITFTGLLILYRICKPFNLFRAILFGLMVLLCGLVLAFVPLAFFEYADLTLQNTLFVVIVIQGSYPIYVGLAKFFSKLKLPHRVKKITDKLEKVALS